MSTGTESTSRTPHSRTPHSRASDATAPAVETRTIDHVPVTERHGRTRDLFTIWFGSNIMLLTIATGALATAVYGLPIWSAALALVLGNLLGAVVMALHAAQGPRMGVPQMVQTRAQFGSYGSLIVVVLVIVMYTGFFASNAVLGGQALASLVGGVGVDAGIIVVSLVSVVAAVVGYRLIHRVATLMSVVSGVVLVLALVWVLAVHPLPSGVWSSSGTTAVGFMGTLSLAALWQIAYAPYVSDYTRYMPAATGAKGAFWGTYSGCVAGSVLPMLFGVLVGAAVPDADTVTGVGELTRGIGGLVIGVLGLGIAATNAMNIYCGALSTITVGQTLVPRWTPRAGARTVITVVLAALTVVLAITGKDDFLVNYTNFLLLLLAVLVPWTAINLVDYYVVRHGDYDIDALFEADGGRYGRVNGIAVLCYLVGIAIQVPFLSNALYTGPVATALGGVDISWVVGLAVISPLYYLLMRATGRVERQAATEAPLPVLSTAEEV